MRTFSATDAALSGFKVLRDRPMLLVVWTLAMFAFWVVAALVVVLIAGAGIMALGDLNALDAQPSLEQVMPLISAMLPAILVLIPLALVYSGVVMAGINRIVLRPEQRAFFFLRLGADELRQVGVMLIQFVAILALYLVMAIIVGIFVAIGSAVGEGATVALAVVGGLAAAALAAFLLVKFSLISAQTFYTGKINIFGSWSLSKGRFWPMFGAYFLAFICAVGVYIVMFVLSLAFQSMALGGNTMAIVGAGLSMIVSGVFSTLLSFVMYLPAPTIFKAIAADDQSTVFE